ncbi:PASTA domain-containing protein [Dactylosporangium sp. CA-092794]|uniref:PASTA domain-containing protein n=1 Tax=Dactylosporangium sp. CA-092794 TaxID=3239929 RepID=UPI003D8E2D47
MSTNWVVTTAGERIALNDARQGETTFTVTNPGERADRVVFEPVPGAGAEAGWFSVDEPQRRVAPAASVSFLVKAQVPEGTAPGTYELQGRVYSADSAPEESSVLSNRVVFSIEAPPAPAGRRIPWWIFAIAAGLVVITVVVVTLVATLGRGGPAQTTPSGPVAVPNLAQLDEDHAAAALAQAGLTGTVRHRTDPAHAGSVLEQSVAAGSQVARGTAVPYVVAVKLTAPTPTTAVDAEVKIDGGRLEWTQAEAYVTHWVVSVTPTMCQGGNVPFLPGGCLPVPLITARVDVNFYAPSLHPYGPFGPAAVTISDRFGWTVAAADDFGNAGPASPERTARMVN